MKKTQLVCTQCGQTYALEHSFPRCSLCHEPLELALTTQGEIHQDNALKQTFLSRYADFYPFLQTDEHLSLGEGFTPCLSTPQLAVDLKLKSLYFKNETFNPTWSFKDRGTLVSIQHAVKLGYKKIGTVSTGNMAASVAAYGAHAGLETIVLVNDTISPEKLNPIAIYGAHLIRVAGDYGALYEKSLQIGQDNAIYFMNSDVPFRIEGSKSIAFEICEQLNFHIPDYIIIPTSAGGNLRGILKGFIEFKTCGLIDHVPTIICAQSAGCAPIHKAFSHNKPQISHFGPTDTIAHGIGNPSPPSGNEVLRQLRRYQGFTIAVDNAQILAAQAQMAQTGIFGQPASAVPLASLIKLRQTERIPENASVACIVTGSGLKYTAAFQHHHLSSQRTTLKNLNSFIQKL